jgi:hypothetical protein
MLESLVWFISWIFWIATLIILFLLGLLWTFQGKLLYFPDQSLKNIAALQGRRSAIQYNPEGFQSLEDYGIEFEQVYFDSVDGEVLHGWFIPCRTREMANESPTIIFFHGNAGSKLQIFLV